MQIKSWHLVLLASISYLVPSLYLMIENFTACKGLCMYDYAINYILLLAIFLVFVSAWRRPGARKVAAMLGIPLSLLIATSVLNLFEAHMALRYFAHGLASRWWSGNLLFYADLILRSLSSSFFFLAGLTFLLNEGGVTGIMRGYAESKAWKSAWWGAMAYCVLVLNKVLLYYGASRDFIAANPRLFLLTLLPYVLQVLLLAAILILLKSVRAVRIGAILSILAGYRIALFAFGSMYKFMQILPAGGGYASVTEYAKYSLLTTAVLLMSSALLFRAGLFFYLKAKEASPAAATQK